MTYWSHSPYSPEYTSTYYSPIDNTTDRNDPNATTGTQTSMSMRRLTWQPPRPTSMRPTSHTHTERNSPLSIQSNATPTSAGVSASAVIPATPSATDTASMTTTASIMINASTSHSTTTATTTPSASGNNTQTELPIMTEGVTDITNNNNNVMYDAAGLPATTIEMTETTVAGYTVDLFAAPPAPTCYEYYVPTYYQYDYNNHNGAHAGNAIPAGAAQPMPFPPPPQPMSYVGPYYVPMAPYEAQQPTNATNTNTTGIPDAMPSPANERSSEPYRYTNEVYGCYRQAYPINSWMHTPHPPYSPAEYYQFAVQQYEQMQQFLPPMMGWSSSNADDAYDEYDENQETLSSPSVLYSVAASLTPASLCHYAMRHCLLCGRPGHCYVDCGLYDGTMLCLYAEQTSKVYVMRHSQWLRSARMGDIVRFAQRALRSPCNTFHLWLDGVSFAAMDCDNATPSSETDLQQSVMRQAWRRRRAMMEGNNNSNSNERTAYISGLCTGCAGLSRAFLSRRCCYYQVLPGRALYISRVREATQSTTASVTVSPSTAPAASPRRETNTELEERNASGTTGNVTTTEVQQGCHTRTEHRRTSRMMEQASHSVSDISVITADLSQAPPSLDTTQQQQQPLMKDEEDGVTLQNNNTITSAAQRADMANNSSTAAAKITTVSVTQQQQLHNCIATREAAAAARRVCTLHIKFIPPHMTTGRLRQLLTFFGTLQRVRLLAPSEFYTLRKPFLLCFVEYSTAQEATMMMRYLHGCRVSRDFTLAAEQPRAAIANRHLSDYDATTGQPCIFGLSHSALQEVQRRYNLPCVTWGMDSMTCAEAAARFDISVDLALVQRRGNNNTTPSNSNKTFVVPVPRSERMTSRTSSRHEESGSEAQVRTRGNNNNSSTQRSGSTSAQSRCSTQSHSSNSSLLLHASRLHEVTRRPEPSEKGKVTQTTFTKPPLSTVTTNIRNTPRKAKPTEEQPRLQKEQISEKKAASKTTTEVLQTDEEEEYSKTEEQDDALQLTRAMVREHTAHYALHSEPTAFFSALRLVETALHAVRERAATIAANTFCRIITRTTTTKHTDNTHSAMSPREGISVSLLHLELLCDEVALFVSDGEVREACAVAKQAVGVVQSALSVLTDNATTSNAITSLYGCDIYTSTPLSEQSYHAGHLELALQESFLSSISNTNKNNNRSTIITTPRQGRECSDMKRYVRLEYVHCALHRLLFILLLLDTLMRSKWSTEVRYTEVDEDRSNKSNRSSTKENDVLTSSDMATGGSVEFVLRTMLHVLRAIRRLFRHTLAPLILPHTREEDGTGSDSVKDTALSFLQVYCHNVQDVLVHDVQDVLEPHTSHLLREGATRRSSAKKYTAMYKPGALLARLQPDVGSFALTILDGKTVTFFT